MLAFCLWEQRAIELTYVQTETIKRSDAAPVLLHSQKCSSVDEPTL